VNGTRETLLLQCLGYRPAEVTDSVRQSQQVSSPASYSLTIYGDELSVMDCGSRSPMIGGETPFPARFMGCLLVKAPRVTRGFMKLKGW
jgi:hypothetical protein